ncbi:hypothetical protein MGG_12906 [Pyricularia oryzae 70-15]|uniref:Ricin B lectin domain-containing protein n=1 Tax=Pyricularia oryzae (strain 70-15 / ATCC MYA-4617 / FGSC 8958) TaxID=242507 RepID=G4N5C3_PYRO7|nr:uncharacterized protein MGG_12906 [Pyricularia oryzae 70-15]EHA52980.1 hypothetical protein MGG_12906 [Pyricularia oryzae 70-15]KAI7910867.1 hypothetical protein M9X92_010844 [Pyricularia oryzae]
MLFTFSTAVAAYAALTSAATIKHLPRAVTSLNGEATVEAHQRDNGATRAFSSVQIKTSDGKCLSVDKFSGDFRANLTPIQVSDCGSTDGQNWDIITSGLHNNVPGSALVVSTLTQACFNFDPRRKAGNQALLFSCGGRADGSGKVTNSQLFPFAGGAGPLTFRPDNSPDTCFTVKGDVIDVAPCQSGEASQTFTLGGAAADNNNNNGEAGSGEVAKPAESKTGTAKASPTKRPATEQPAAAPTAAPGTGSGSGNAVVAIPNPTAAVPVSRAGGTLNPTAAAEANERDDTATRAFTSVSIQTSSGKCLFVDPTAGDFRQNLIPVSLVDCSGTPNEKFDLITAGKHNDAKGAALLVSSLTNGCVSPDSRRQPGDTVTVFSCGGRAAGEGKTNSGQTFPFNGTETSFVFAPRSDNGKLCVIPGNGRLEAGPCPTDGSQIFKIVQ